MKTKWQIQPMPEIHQIDKLSSTCHISRLLSVLMLLRGINQDNALEFLNKSDKNIVNPYLFKDMRKAVLIIKDYIEKNKKITVFGDYDADGVTATALLVKALKKLNANVDFYIPQRDTDGYGVSRNSINILAERNTDLIITVDCGITAVAECIYAKTKGMEMIITDHHECSDIIPDALAVIDAKVTGETYPHSNLAGVGVALKVAQALLEDNQSFAETSEEFSELVAIGSIADIVPMLGENRYYCDTGLKKINNNPSVGISSLLKVSQSIGYIDTTKVGFVIAPRINASGRLTNASFAIDLLLEDDEKKAEEQAQSLNNFNIERQKIEAEIFLEAESDYLKNYSNHKIVVLFNKNWHHGVVGIVSSRLTKKYLKPFILISTGVDGNCKGSGRSVEGFSLYKALENTKDTIVSFGGHELAAGVVIKEDSVNEFRNKINNYAEKYFSDNEIVNIISGDCELKGRHLNLDVIKDISLLEPYGTKNQKPIFFIRNLKVISAYFVGNNKQHLKLNLAKDGVTIDGVAFNYEKENIAINSIISVMCYLEVNEYKNICSPQLRILDIKGEIYGRTM